MLSGFEAPSSGGSSLHPTPARSPDISNGTAVTERGGADLQPKPSPLASPGKLLQEDDPFELSDLPQSRNIALSASKQGEDDILGDLAMPVSEVEERKRVETRRTPHSKPRLGGTAHDEALAELVDMGFSPERGQYALSQTGSGQDVQAAVGVLLNEAHSASNDKSTGRSSRQRQDSRSRQPRRKSTAANHEASDTPPWLNGPKRSQSRNKANTPNGEEKEFAQYATDIGSSVWKSANSLWKTGQKRVAKAVSDLQQEGDPSQPRWLRDAQPEQAGPDSSQASARARASDVTNEAMMLDSNDMKSSTKQPQQRRPSDPRTRSSPATRRDSRSSGAPSPATRPHSRPQSARAEPTSRPAQKLSRQAVEEQTAQAYISPARRKKQQQVSQPPETGPRSEPQETLDIFSSEPIAEKPKPARPPNIPQKSSPLPSRPRTKAAPPRRAPPIPESTLRISHQHRKAGTDAFKRGDYVTAHSNYSTALNGLPPPHPITIIIRSNRAITSIKSGDAKAALNDAEAALQVIGPNGGVGESILLSEEEGEKPMREFFGKALMRKAEALEHMEKYGDAAKVWREAVQAGIGGNVAIQGRNRCDNASTEGKAAKVNGHKVKPATKPKPAVKAPPRPSAIQDLGGPAPGEAEAVKRLRAAEAAAVVASDEAFALSDAVEARISNWKGGKADNLRALLGSLDTILWADAGWNKVGMSDLVLPQKVKIVYMKAIAKVHPDKVSQFRSIDQRDANCSKDPTKCIHRAENDKRNSLRSSQ